MRRSVQAIAMFALFMSLPGTGHAAEDDGAAVFDKAMKAHFPKGIDTKNQGSRTKSKGTLQIMGLDVEFSQEIYVQLPNKFKENSELTVNNMQINVVTVFNGKEGWIRANDNDVPVTEDILNELKEAAFGLGVLQGILLKDKSVKLALVGESKVNGKPAIGISIAREGKRQINVYVDKESHLIAKVETRKKDIQSGQEILEERLITEYQEIDGRKVAKKIEILRDGKSYMKLEVLEVATLEKVDNSEFEKPK